ncbi:hypothetical protein [Allopontixanthobacter sediminis]|uniref:Uncharacterized protein n=1 Tax=Allopontixanthobacter sediminis TaxID=1689985 RepID=A0A845AYH9_9SPHN|nr:hypothetical protein [Allopontixanthobacter sediminis]MXP42998.1 hypothetical protein [Allopontixanthobacter sediminis]
MTIAVIKTGAGLPIIRTGENTAEAARQAGIASNASNAAVAAGNYFSSKAEGEAGTAAPDFFSYPDGAGGLIYAERTVDGGGDAGGDSVIIAEAATQAQLDQKIALSALAAPDGANLSGFLQLGTGATPTTVEEELSRWLWPQQFGVSLDGATDDTAGWKKAIVAARVQGKALFLPKGRTVVSDELIDDTIFNGLDGPALVMRGQGMNSTVFVNNCVGKSPFNIGNTYFTELTDFKVEGNGLTGASGNSHALSMVDPDFNSGTFKPGTVYVRRVWVTDHRGDATDYAGNAMPACGLYVANGINLVFDGLFIQSCTIGAYVYKSYEPKFYNLVLDANYNSGLVDDQNENLNIYSGVALDNDSSSGGAIALHDTSSIRAGSVVHYNSRGSNYLGTKYKSHRYTGISVKGATYPLIQGNWFLFNQDGEYEIYGIDSGLRVLANTFDLSPTSGGTRSVLKLVMGGGINDIGSIRDNVLRWFGGGAVQQVFDIDGSAAAALRGSITDNIIGDATPPGNACTVVDAIRVSGQASQVRIRNNRLNSITGVTVTDFIDLSGCSKYPLDLEGNQAIADGGAVTNNLNPVIGWTYDPASLASGASVSVNQTLTGVALGDFVLPSFSLDLQGVTLTAAIKSADTIAFTFSNLTGAAVDLGSGSLYAKIFKRF